MKSLRDRQIESMTAVLVATLPTGLFYMRPLAEALVDKLSHLPEGVPAPASGAVANPDFLPLCRLLGPVLDAAAKGEGLSAMECAALAEQVLADLRNGAAGGVR
jgi:hypothetical protein